MNEKLKLMLNKVVEFNDQKSVHFKAFLYKNKSGYYFKVIEIMKGDMSFNDIITLNEGDENFLIIASKPKLMVVDKNSWHYSLMKYVLKSAAPTPKDMQNGCPYFWLVLFSLIAVSFIELFKVIKWTMLLIPKAIFWVLKQLVMSWINGIDDAIAYDLKYSGGAYSNIKVPKTVRMLCDKTNKSVFDLILTEKYGLVWSDPEYTEKEEEMRKKWDAYVIETDKDYLLKLKAKNEKKQEHDKRRAKSKAEWDAKMKPFYDGLDNIALKIKEIFTVERGKLNNIIKFTKNVTGIAITALILVVTYYGINFIAKGIMAAVDFSITHWYIFAAIGLLAIAAGIIYGLYILVVSLGQNIFNNYRKGKKLWYVEPFIYLIWYPIKYIVLFFVFIFAKVLWIPVRFIFYTCIWSVLAFIGIRLGKGLFSLGKFIIGSTGIFGEYFGASYSDFCPGLEWVGFDDEEKEEQ